MMSDGEKVLAVVTLVGEDDEVTFTCVEVPQVEEISEELAHELVSGSVAQHFGDEVDGRSRLVTTAMNEAMGEAEINGDKYYYHIFVSMLRLWTDNEESRWELN